MGKIFSDEDVIKYAETRLFGSNVKPEDVHQIHLHNGMLPSELEAELQWPPGEMPHDVPPLVEQENGREPIYFDHGELHIPQYSGFGRRRRYEEMVNAYMEANGKEDDYFVSHEREDDRRLTNIFYDNFAYDLVKALFVPDQVEEGVFESNDMKDVKTVIFGPTNAVEKNADVEVLEKGNSEYLDSQIVRIGEEMVLNLSYVYADQAGIIVDKMTREYEALYGGMDRQQDIRFFMFGRVGGLRGRRGEVIIPGAIIDETDLLQGRLVTYPFYNIVQPERIYMRGNLFSANSVINQTSEPLIQAANNWGCTCVEMEVREIVESINKSRRRYFVTLNIDFGFVGHVSDVPLYVRDDGTRDTLAEELDSDKGEQEAVRLIVEEIDGSS